MLPTSLSTTGRALSSITTPNSLRRVVITGLGAITPLGKTFQSSWDALNASTNNKTINGDVGITTLEEAILHQNLSSKILDHDIALAKILPSQVAAPVRGVNSDPRTARFVQFAMYAGEEAMHHAGLFSFLGLPEVHCNNEESHLDPDSDDHANTLEYRRCRIGVCIGSGMSCVREIVASHETVIENNSLRKLYPHFIPKVLSNSAASRLSLQFKLKGPNLAPTTACAAGAHAIGESMRCIQYGDADVMLAGGAEACIDPMSMAGFCRLKALSSKFNDNPLTASRPFDNDRDGFVMGEGASVLVLEGLDHAKERGANILCELRGYGLTGDGFHVTSPDPDGAGAERAMNMALKRAGIAPQNVDYVNAHATSTPMGDVIEENAINRSVGNNSNRERPVLVSSTKGATGHLLGAAGAIESAFTVMSIVDSLAPPTKNLNVSCEKEDIMSLQHVTRSSTEQDITIAMSNSFGFGGTNASLVFSAYK